MNLNGPMVPTVPETSNGKGSTKIESTATQNNGATSNGVSKLEKAPNFLEASEVEALIRFATNPIARLCMNMQWRAGLTVDEILTIRQSDLHLPANSPELRIQPGNDGNGRVIPIHQHLGFSLLNAIFTWNKPVDSPLIDATLQQVSSWYEDSLKRCYEFGAIPAGITCDMNTLRHSSARHWLQNGVPINVVSKWLGHPELSATMIYAEFVNDTGRFMERVL